MTSHTRVTMHKGAAALIAIALLAAGAGATYLLTRNDAGTGGHVVEMSPTPRAQPSPAGAGRLLRDLWPRPMEAAVYLQRALDPRRARSMRAAAFVRRRLWSPLWHVRAHALMWRGGNQ